MISADISYTILANIFRKRIDQSNRFDTYTLHFLF